MNMRRLTGGMWALFAGALCGMSALAQPALTSTLVVSGLERPIFVTHSYGVGGFDRIFVLEKRGRIRVVRDGNLLASPFLDIDALVGGGTVDFSERGLLGLAFHPDYANNGKFYVNYTNNSGNTMIVEYQVSANPDVADAGSARIMMVISQPFANHNGGWLGFGPDGYMYIATGDGGDANDPGNRAQDITGQLLGKMLRIDVDARNGPTGQYGNPIDNPFVGVAGDDEIWAYGLRNPWRPSFDRETGDLWIADVGQDVWEEISFQPADSTGGENYGWRCYEGNHDFNTTGCAAMSTMVFPVHEYSHSTGCSITGGYVYRGCAIPGLRGTYFFADFCFRTIWSFEGSGVSDFTDRTAELAPGGGLTIATISSFGEDAAGELYICDQNGGEIFKIVPECRIDYSGDGIVDVLDFFGFVAAFDAVDCSSDLTGNNIVDVLDFFEFITQFNQGCP